MTSRVYGPRRDTERGFHERMEPGTRPSKSPKSPKTPNPSPLRRQRALALIIIGAALLAATVVFAVLGITAHGSSDTTVHQSSISQILALADQHKLKSATLAGNTVTVTATDGQQYVATKEDGQQLTNYLLAHGVKDVSVAKPADGTPSWVSIAMDVALFGFLAVLVVIMLRRSNSGGGPSQAAPFGRSR